MRSTSANYATRNALNVQNPVVLISLGLDVVGTILNPGFEIAGAGGADVFFDWTEAGTGTITDETSIVHSGGHAAKLATAIFPNTAGLNHEITVAESVNYILSFWSRGDGTNAGRYAIFDNTNAEYIVFTESTLITGAAYEYFSKSFTTPSGCVSIQVYLSSPNISGGYAYFDDFTMTCAARQYSSGTFNNITSGTKKYLRSLNTNLGNIEPLECHSEIESTSFEIVDKDLDVTTQLKNYDFENSEATVKIGFSELDDDDFVSLPPQYIRDIKLNPGLLSWTFTARDTKYNLNNSIFRALPKTNLTADITKSSTALAVANSDPFILTSELPGDLESFVVIDEEIMQYKAKTASTSFNILTRGAMGTIATAHSDGALVTQFIGFQWIDPMQALLYLLMTTDDGTGHAYYDINAFLTTKVPGIGLGMSSSDIDIETIERLGYKYFEYIEYGLRIGGFEESLAYEWIETNILKPSSCYIYLNAGKISVASFDYLEIAENYSAVDTLDEDDIISGDYQLQLDDLINVIEIRYDQNPITKQFKKTETYKFDDSVTEYGQNQTPFVIEHPNILINTNTNYIADAILRRWFYLWGNQTARYSINTKANNWLVEPGDYLSISYNQFPDLVTGTRGWTAKKSIVLSQTINWMKNPAEFNLTGLTWEILTRVASLYVKMVEEEVDITRTAATFSVDNTAELEAADAYVDFVSGSMQIYIVWVKITPPGVASPTTNNATIGLGFHIQTVVGTDTLADNRAYIRYDPASSIVMTLGFMLSANADFTAARLKVDWYAASQSEPSGERPSAVSLYEVWRINLSKAISLL